MKYALWIEKDQRFAFSTNDNGGKEIDDTEFAKLIDSQSTGKVIAKDDSGNPVIGNYIPTETEKKEILKRAARAALSQSDTVLLRCYEHCIEVPDLWQKYRAELRAIVNGTDITSTVLPDAPDYPAST